MPPTLLLHGPQGSGKTLLAPYLANKLGLHSVIEIEGPRTPWPAAGALLVTSDPDGLLPGFTGQCMHVDEAMRLLGVQSVAQLLHNQH